MRLFSQTNRTLSLSVVIGAACLLTRCAMASPPAGYYLVWADEFNGASLDSTKWNIETGARRDALNTAVAVSMNGSNLVITTYTTNNTQYTALIETAGKFNPRYGYTEASIKWGDSSGMWSAFWMWIGTMTSVGDVSTYGAEMDVCEHRLLDGNNGNASIKNQIQCNIHWDGYASGVGQSAGSGNLGSGLGSGFHTYGFQWDSTQYRALIDGTQLYSTSQGHSDRSEYLIFSSEVDDTSTTWAGAIPSGGYGNLGTSTTKLSVDYVRFYAPTTTVYFAGSSSGAWNNSANWIAGTDPASGFDVVFSYLSTNNLATTLGQNYTLNSLTFLETPASVTVSGDALTIGSGGINLVSAINDPTIISSIVLNSAQTWKSSSGRTLVVSGQISGSPNLILDGYGNVQLTASNSLTGKLSVNSGALIITNENELGPNPASFTADQITLNGGSLQSGTSGSLANVTLSNTNRGITLGGDGGTLQTFFQTYLTISNVISGTGALTKTSVGTLNLNVANTFTGNTRVKSGALILYNTNALQNSTVDMNAADAGSLNLNNINACLGGLQGSRALALGTGNISVGNNNQSTIFSGTISGSGSLVKIGAGGLTLVGANNYTGKTSVNAGSLIITNVAALGVNPAGYIADQLTLNGGALCTAGNATNVILNNSNCGITLGIDGGAVQSAFTISNVIAGTGSLRIFQPTTVLVAAPGGGFVESFHSRPAGDWLDNGSLVSAGTLVGGMAVNSPFGLAVRGTNLFIAEATAGGRILQFDTSGNYQKTVYTLPSVNIPRYLAFGSDGYLYMSDAFGTNGDEVWRFNVTNNTGSVWIPTTFVGGTFNNPQQMAWGPDGYFYIGDRQNNLIRKFDSGGNFVSNLVTITQPLALQWDTANNQFLVGAGFTEDIGAVTLKGTETNCFNGASNEGALGIAIVSGDAYYTRYSSGSSTPGVYRIGNSTNSTKVTEAIFAANTPGQIVVLPLPSGVGSLNLAAANTFTGDTRVSDGALALLHTNALQDSTLDMNSSDTGSVNLNNLNARLGGLKGSRNLAFGAGSISIGGNNSDTIYSGALSGSGSMTKLGSGTFTLSGTNNFSGGISIEAGTLQVLSSIASGAITVGSGATLAGTGALLGAVSVQNGGTITAGGSIGTLIISNSLTLAGITHLKLDKSGGTNDLIRGLTSTTYGGTLILTNISAALGVGDSFKLFAAASYSGAFTNLSPRFPGAGLAWNTVSLVTNGILKVISLMPPAFTGITNSGGSTFQILASGNAGQTYSIYSSTNLALPFGQWPLFGTATANDAGAISFADTHATNRQQFYRLSIP